MSKIKHVFSLGTFFALSLAFIDLNFNIILNSFEFRSHTFIPAATIVFPIEWIHTLHDNANG